MRNSGVWAIYDKAAGTLTNYLTSVTRELIENDLEPLGVPFMPEGVTHRNEMYRIFTKDAIKKLIDSREYNNDKLQAVYNNISDSGALIMIVK